MSDSRHMQQIEEITRRAVYKALGLDDPSAVMLGISNRHVHLTKEDCARLFGKADLTPVKTLRQINYFAAKETVTVHGPRSCIPKVRVLGPFRTQTQVELNRSDAFALGIDAPLCESGHLDLAAPVDIEGPTGKIHLEHGAMVAGRHVHLGPEDLLRMGLKDQDRVSIKFPGLRGGVLDNFLIRVKDLWVPEVHIDVDEGNSVSAKTGDVVQILRSR